MRFTVSLTMLSLAVLLAACGGGSGSAVFVSHDLMATQGIPLTIKAPKGITVKKSDMGLLQEFDISDTTQHYSIRIYSGEVLLLSSPESTKKERLSDEQANSTFSKVVKEDPNGFIYEVKWYNDKPSYAFFYVVHKGDKYYQFTSTPTMEFSLEQIQAIYDGVKQL